jgi:hypothetical protein
VFPCDNFEQIAKVLNTPPTQPVTVLLPNLLPSPLLPTHTALPPQTATLPQPPTLPYPSSHACLSNHYDAGSACPSVSSSHKNAAPASVGTISSPPFTSPSLAKDNATTDSTSAYSPSSACGRFSLNPSG